MLYATYEAFDETGEKEEESKKDLRRTGKFFGGLREDIKSAVILLQMSKVVFLQTQSSILSVGFR
jgi:hypothetical protein